MTSDAGPCRIDLHVHTLASDGLLSSSAVVDLAKSAGLSAVAITDHDTLGGLDEALARGAEVGIEVVTGVELTAYLGQVELHIVGLFVDHRRTVPAARVEELRKGRESRMERMIENLRDAGVAIGMAEVTQGRDPGALGRPHLAMALVRGGHVSDVGEAFHRYLGANGRAYVRKTEVTPAEAIGLVRELRGVSVLAHPGVGRVDSRLGELAAMGLDAIEVWHPKHNFFDVEHYRKLARRRGLLPSGGSDFHGEALSESQIGEPSVGCEVLAALRDRCAFLNQGG